MTAPASIAQRSDIGSPIRVLLAEDEAHLGNVLEQYLSARGFAVTRVRDGRAALEQLRASAFDVALLDIVMPEVDGLEVLRQVREEASPPEIIVISGNGTSATAVAALKLGAYDLVSKPYSLAGVDALIRRAWEKRLLTRDNYVLHARLHRATEAPQFVTQYAPLVAIRRLVEQVSPGGSPVLITGPRGAGKRLIARLVHASSRTPDGPFVEASCASTAEPVTAATLFGRAHQHQTHELHRSLGLMELADGGTLYLSDIGALDLATQEALEQALDRGSFVCVGGTRPVVIGARVVTSSTEDLQQRAARGEFRQDLLHRITAVTVTLPPLVERHTDITLLGTHFLRRFTAGRPPVLTDDAVALLERYEWPGNVSELRVVMERAAMLMVDGRVTAGDLSLATGRLKMRAVPDATDVAAASAPLTLGALERQHIGEVLDRVQWHQGRAASLLGISPKTLYRKMREFGFRRPTKRRGTS